ncbi:MAG: ORF6N domain-containing protein [Flavobacteriales bacterium]|nr:ORF6N domain-containing protein [Flavobacteriales bacterium]
MLDRDLAELYQVEVNRLNEQVKRNIERFPEHFMFQLTQNEWEKLQIELNQYRNPILRSQFATAKRRTAPYMFTEQGVAMLSSVLKSETAIIVSIQIMDAFVEMRKVIAENTGILQRMDNIERKLLESDQKFDLVFKALGSNETKHTKGIFFEGQLFDAYVFANNLIKGAKQSIILIDNYVDETTLLMLSKRNSNCKVVIYTPKINSQLQLDLDKHNEQYPLIEIKKLITSHDRFLIIDEKELYHIGASLKDLGKKWFAFSKLDEFLPEILRKLNTY